MAAISAPPESTAGPRARPPPSTARRRSYHEEERRYSPSRAPATDPGGRMAREAAVRPRTTEESSAVADQGRRWPGRSLAGRRARFVLLAAWAGTLAVAALAPAAPAPPHPPIAATATGIAAGAFSAARPGAGPPPGWRVWAFERIAVRTRYEL